MHFMNWILIVSAVGRRAGKGRRIFRKAEKEIPDLRIIVEEK